MTEHELTKLIRNLKEFSPRQAGPLVEVQLVAAFRERHPKRMPAWRHWRQVAASLVAGGLLFFAWSHWRATKPPRVDSETTGFIALPYSQSGVPMEQAVIVRMSIPAATLTSMGMRLPLAPEKNVNAELLVGQDGVARAVRILR